MNKPQRRKQEDRRQDAESKLLDAAVELVAERGYDRFTLADVGEMANFSRGLPAHYFGTKDNLLSIVAERIVALFLARLDERKTSGEGLEPIFESLHHIVQRTTEGQLASRALPVIIGAALVNPELAASLKTLNDAGIDWIADVLRVGVKAGYIRADIDPYCEAPAITAMHRGCTIYYMLDSNFPIQKVMENFIVELDKRLSLKPSASLAAFVTTGKGAAKGKAAKAKPAAALKAVPKADAAAKPAAKSASKAKSKRAEA